MTVSTFYPDANPETTSVDGYVLRNPGGAGEAFGTIRGGAGTSGADSEGWAVAQLKTSTTSPNYIELIRAIFLFDTASLPDGDTVDVATFEFVSSTKINQFAEAGSLALVLSTPASNTALVSGDYGQLGTVKQAPDITIAGITADSATYNVMTLDATGRGNISKTGVSKFGVREVGELDNVAPTWASDVQRKVDLATAEEALAGDKRPKLVVTHTAPPSTFVPKMLAF